MPRKSERGFHRDSARKARGKSLSLKKHPRTSSSAAMALKLRMPSLTADCVITDSLAESVSEAGNESCHAAHATHIIRGLATTGP